MANFVVRIEGTLFDGRVVRGEPTCLALTGEYCCSADSAEAACDKVRAHVIAAYRHPVELWKVVAGTHQADRLVKRGGTKACPLVK